MTNTLSIEEGNKLIAIFMGFTERFDLRTDGKPMYQRPLADNETHSPCYSLEENEEFLHLQYHTSWDWLMPVCQKLELKTICTDINQAWNEVLERIKQVA